MHALVKSTNVRAMLRRMSASKGSLFKNLQAVADSQFTQHNKNITAMPSHVEVTACSQFSPPWQRYPYHSASPMAKMPRSFLLKSVI